jgi:hypothetical protein
LWLQKVTIMLPPRPGADILGRDALDLRYEEERRLKIAFAGLTHEA